MPSSPPKKTTIITEHAAINSPTPKEIIAKTVPALRVENNPTMVAMPSPERPPNIGRNGNGKRHRLCKQNL